MTDKLGKLSVLKLVCVVAASVAMTAAAFLGANLLASLQDRWYVAHECPPQPPPDCLPHMRQLEEFGQRTNIGWWVFSTASLLGLLATFLVLRKGSRPEHGKTDA